VRHACHPGSVPVLLAGVLVTVLVMLVLAVAPVFAGVSLLFRLTRKQAGPAKPTPAERLLGRPLSTGALAAWLVIPLLVIGLWATADALTQGSGSTTAHQQPMSAGGLAGIWKTSHGATVIFAAAGHFTEMGLPGPPPGDAAMAGLTIPRSAAGTWQLSSAFYGQYVMLTFSSGAQLEFEVTTWQPVTGSPSAFVLQMYPVAAGLDPAYQLIREGGT
jgi:hypothetical protein